MGRPEVEHFIEIGKPIGSEAQQWMNLASRTRSVMADSVDESGLVTRQEVLWAATNGPQSKVDVTGCPSRLAISLWRFAHAEPAKFHTTYASKLVEKVGGSVAEGGVDPQLAAEVRDFEEVGQSFIREFRESRDA